MSELRSEIYEKLSILQWLMQRYRMSGCSSKSKLKDTTRGQGRVLAMLKVKSDITTKDLAYLLGIRQQSLNELLNKLEKNGYIRREQSENDKRVYLVKLTEKGRELEQEEEVHADIFEKLTDDELDNFGDYLDKIISVLEEKVGMDSDENIEEWIEEARLRMGDEELNNLMSMGRNSQKRAGCFGKRGLGKGMGKGNCHSEGHGMGKGNCHSEMKGMKKGNCHSEGHGMGKGNCHSEMKGMKKGNCHSEGHGMGRGFCKK